MDWFKGIRLPQSERVLELEEADLSDLPKLFGREGLQGRGALVCKVPDDIER